jgi:hypothetical protein
MGHSGLIFTSNTGTGRRREGFGKAIDVASDVSEQHNPEGVPK